MLFRYPNNSTEVRNLDWIVKTVEELDLKMNTIFEDAIIDKINEYFEKLVLTMLYDDNNERLVVDFDSSLIIDDGHIYNSQDETITIEGREN